LTRPGERVKVLRVIARLNVGGPALHAVLLTSRLDPTRYQSLLVTGVEDPREGNYLTLRGISLEHLTTLPGLGREIRPFRDLQVLVQLIRLIRRTRPRIVHTHTAKAGVLGRLAAHFAGVPLIVHTYHGHVFHGYFSRPKTRVLLAIERWLARRTDRLLTVSERVRGELLALGVGRPERLTAMPLGLELDRFLDSDRIRGQLRAELGLGPSAPLVGIVARLVPIKAHEIFLRAVSSVAREIPESRFLVVGDGERRTELEALGRALGLARRLQFLGWRSDVERIYADLDLVVLSSRNEGSPVSLIEAMAAARPVVATRVGGVPDVVEDGATGLLVEAGDIAGMAKAITTLLRDPERARTMGIEAQKRVYPAFGVERLIADMDRLYMELLTARPA